MLSQLEPESVHCCVTSPPYFGLRDYGVAGQIGLEQTPDAYVEKLVDIFSEVRRVLKDDGTLWLNLGDTYASAWPCNRRNQIGSGSLPNGKREARPPRMGEGLKEKDLIGIPWMVAFALRADGWYLRSDIIWHKPNPMPESVTDRPTSAHEHIFLLAKSERYYFDSDAVRVPFAAASVARLAQDIENQTGSDRAHAGGKTNGNMKAVKKTDKQRGHSRRHAGFNDRWDAMERGEQLSGGANIRNVWTIATQPYSGAHFATFPPALIEPCIKAGCPMGGTVMDPFFGAGTTGLVADRLGRNCVGIELSPAYVDIAKERLTGDAGMFATVTAQ